MQPFSVSNPIITGSHIDRLLRVALALFVTISILSFGTLTKATPGAESRAIVGSISISGVVNVNGQRASDGQTLFAKSSVETASVSESLITLRNGSRLNLSAESALMIESSERRVFGSMPTGRALLNIPASIILDFSTADVSINKTSVDDDVLIIVETTECRGTKLSVMKGQIEAHANGRHRVVKFGESVSTSPAQTGQQQTRYSWSNKKTLGVIFGVGGAVAILLAVALGNNDENQQTPGGGTVCILSPVVGGGC